MSTSSAPQPLLDPADTSSATQLEYAPDLLPPSVRDFGFIPDFRIWKTGDLLLFFAAKMNFLQRAIVNAQERIGHAPEHAKWHHAAVYIGDRTLCEATFAGVRYQVISDVFLNTRIRIRRDPRLNMRERHRVAIRALIRLTKPYAYLSVLGSWRRLQRKSPSTAEISRDLPARGKACICSELYHEAYMAVTSQRLLADPDGIVYPAALSACERLDDIPVAWGKLT